MRALLEKGRPALRPAGRHAEALSQTQCGGHDRLCRADLLLWISRLKAVIDRFYPLCHGDDKRRAFADKESALILCGASEEEDDFEPAVANYEVMADYLGWEDRGILVASGLGDIGDAAKSEWLEAARDLAMDL